MKKIFCCPALELFHCLPPLFHCLPLWTTVRLHGKKLQNATNSISAQTSQKGIKYTKANLYTVQNRDQPENIDHELWMDTDQPLPTLNLFTVSAVNDMTVSNNNYILILKPK